MCMTHASKMIDCDIVLGPKRAVSAFQYFAKERLGHPDRTLFSPSLSPSRCFPSPQ
jgi:hypothetical protein